MEYTKNYHLPQWAEEDRIQMEDFNDAMASIENGLDAANQTAAAVQEQLGLELAELVSEVGSGGKTARIAWGSYKGNGKYGSGNPNALTFDFMPVAVIIGGSDGYAYPSWPTVAIRGVNGAHGDCVPNNSYSQTITWTTNGLSWYSADHPSYQNNSNGSVYYYVALGYNA